MTSAPSTTRTRPEALLRLLVAGALALALGASTLLPVAGTAAAKEAVTSSSSSYLCTGYDACARAGYGHAGYRERGGTMYWNMYSGHNCTNYAAYRMVQAGMPNVRPWSGSGNAMFWGTSNASKTDRTPEVGAVAWFRANRSGVSGSAGHVAYVERVVSPTEIIVSEDSWGGDFHWRRYSVAAGTWPDGFIHFVAKPTAPAPPPAPALTNTGLPKVVGTPRVGEPLSSGRGVWSNRIDGVTRQWLVDGEAVDGATSKRFTPRPADRGEPVALRVTARKKGFEPATAVSVTAPAIERGRFVAQPPTLSGTPEVGQVLTATPGVTAPDPNRTLFAWFADGEQVAGQTGPRLSLTPGLEGARITVRTTARGPAFVPGRTRSAPTAPVAPPALTVVTPARVSGVPLLGQELAVDPGIVAPSGTAVRYRWFRDGTPIKGARGAVYPVRTRDVGTWLSVRVKALRDGYRESTQVVEVERAVRTVPLLDVVATGKPGRARVELALTTAGVEAPTGEALVKVGAVEVPVLVEDGVARVVVQPLTAGQRRVTVRFLGSELVEPATATSVVTVLPPR